MTSDEVNSIRGKKLVMFKEKQTTIAMTNPNTHTHTHTKGWGWGMGLNLSGMESLFGQSIRLNLSGI